jgi:hypothetical protein
MNPYQSVNIDGVDLPTSEKWKRIGVSVSGGADSALLAFLVCLHTDAEIHIVSQIRGWKTKPWQRQNSLDVFNWLVNHFPNTSFKRHEGFIPPDLEWADKGPNIVDEYGKLKSGNQIILRSHNEYIAHKENLDAWFAAVNKNPSVHFDGALEDRDESHLPLVMEHMGVTVCHPFAFTMKDWIVKQYQEYDILELLNITRSCEGDLNDYPEVFGNLDYRTYKPGQLVPTCGKCFWCKEKEWAIEQAIK